MAGRLLGEAKDFEELMKILEINGLDRDRVIAECAKKGIIFDGDNIRIVKKEDIN